MRGIINQKILKKYAGAFIRYEIDTHGVDPRDTLEGTSLRLSNLEGYKLGVYEENRQKIDQGGPYSDIIIDAMPGYNLVSYYQKERILNTLQRTGTSELEDALTLLFEDENDELAFQSLVEVLGGVFDVLGFIFFLKDCDRYLPIRSRIFDDLFKHLEIQSNLAYNCSWEKYQQFVAWIKDIQDYLILNVNKDITLLDAHSFLWMIDKYDKEVWRNGQIAVHKKYGKGILVETGENYFIVRFSGIERKLQKDIVLPNGILTVEHLDNDADISSVIVDSDTKPSDAIKPLSNKAIEVAWALLELINNNTRSVTYSELSDMTESKPSAYYEMRMLLDAINKRCDLLGLPYISAMVVNKGTGLPGDGFRDLCIKEFGYDEALSTQDIVDLELDKILKCDRWGVLVNYLTSLEPTICSKSALENIIGDVYSEDDPVEKELIDRLVNASTELEKPEWPGIKEAQVLKISEKTGRETPKRDQQRATDALRHAGYLCEYNNEDRTFLRRNGKPYTEPHHLIPISRYKDFDYSVDVMENIVSLCSHCHNLLHYGRFEDKRPILKKLYSDRCDALRMCGLDLTMEELEAYYK